MLGPDIDCEDDTEFSLTEDTSSQEQEYIMEDMLATLDESSESDDENVFQMKYLIILTRHSKEKVLVKIIFGRKKNGSKRWSWNMSFTNLLLMKCWMKKID